jgi:methionyl-tRNA synthetase
VLARPFLPGKAEQIWSGLGVAPDSLDAAWNTLESPPVAGRRVARIPVLFPKPRPAA